MIQFKAWAKFLITGEYLILHGAKGLALPLSQYFQELKITPNNNDFFSWKAFDEKNSLWFEANFETSSLQLIDSSDQIVALKISEMLSYLKKLRPNLFKTSLQFVTHMNFSRHWGLGSSSTFVSLLAQWSQTDAFHLQKMFFGGSGYDVACATANSPLIYELQNNRPQITPVRWSPVFKNNLYFLYLGQKQDTREALVEFHKKIPSPSQQDLQQVNRLTQNFLMASNLCDFMLYMKEHENLISQITGQKRIKDKYFSDFDGEMKSLGAWGGDFILVASIDNPRDYFINKGYTVLKNWNELI